MEVGTVHRGQMTCKADPAFLEMLAGNPPWIDVRHLKDRGGGITGPVKAGNASFEFMPANILFPANGQLARLTDADGVSPQFELLGFDNVVTIHPGRWVPSS